MVLYKGDLHVHVYTDKSDLDVRLIDQLYFKGVY